MSQAAEAAGIPPGIASLLQDGLNTISQYGSVTFTLYQRVVLPVDGFVFYVKTPQTLNVMGSFHYSSQTNQEESSTEGVNAVVFSAEQPIQAFNEVQPIDIWVGLIDGDGESFDAPIQFAFSSRGRYYEQADLYHYTGTALTPTLKAQLVDDSTKLEEMSPFVSNSLPIWLSLSSYSPPYASGIENSIPLFPSFLVPENQQPPFIAVHIEESSTQALQAAPFFDRSTSQDQECQDEVRCTLYGLNNLQAQTFLAAVLQYSMDYCTMGVNNLPTIRDRKKTSSEFNMIAQMKTIEFSVAYNQLAVRNIAKQMISKVITTYMAQPLSSATFGPAAPF